jgi:hypothetical protein
MTTDPATDPTLPTLPGFDSADLEAVRAEISVAVAGGFTPPDLLEEQAIEALEDCAPEGTDGSAVEDYAARLIAGLLVGKVREEAGWPAVTDNDRLDGAFALLEKQGIVARQHWTCCSTCGFAEIGEALDEWEREHGRPARGFTFFHAQDTDRAVVDGYLYLCYGAAEDAPTEAATLAVAARVVDALRSAGLSVEWDGSVRTRIAVTAFDWKRRGVPAA